MGQLSLRPWSWKWQSKILSWCSGSAYNDVPTYHLVTTLQQIWDKLYIMLKSKTLTDHCDLDLEDSNPIFSHDILVHDDALSYQTWLEEVKQYKQYFFQTTHIHTGKAIPIIYPTHSLSDFVTGQYNEILVKMKWAKIPAVHWPCLASFPMTHFCPENNVKFPSHWYWGSIFCRLALIWMPCVHQMVYKIYFAKNSSAAFYA